MEGIYTTPAPDVSSPVDKKKEDEVKLPGFRFYPTDEELVGFYLRRKVDRKPLRIELIAQIDIYKYDPWDLPKGNNVGDKEWYFFCMRGRKYKNSVRPNRVTGSGFWKATGIDKPIYSTKQPHECVGLKKSLVYYRGHAGKGTKTDWMMHEFRLPPAGKMTENSRSIHNIITEDEAEVWTLCRIFKRMPSSSRKFTPEWKEKEPITVNKVTTPTDSSSKTSSLESDSGECYVGFGDSVIVCPAGAMKPEVDEGDFFSENYMNLAYNLGSWDSNGQDFVMNESWDELTAAFQRTIDTDPSMVYGYSGYR